MDFVMFTQLFNKIDQVTATYVTDISSKAIIAITPIVSIGLTIAFITYGWLIIRGTVDMPIVEFINHCLRVSIITSIALTAGLYQNEIANLITKMPNDLLHALMPTAPQNADFIELINKVAENGFKRASEAFEEAAFLNSEGLLYGLFGILILLATSFLAAIGGGFILLAKIALILLIGLGPFFIIALLWQPTYHFFEQWIAQILNYTVLITLLATVFKLMMSIFANYMNDLQFDGHQNVSYALGGVLILSILSIMLLFKLSSIASALARGVTFGHLWRLNSVGNNAFRDRYIRK
ncbi:type IV secretion system protein [Bartonella harrusi]|uniref:Type IV secretion system protein n=1 Tax=Bartonella harrusi TaxID=2961895 RepID=A0ABY5ESD8_9HYPH|nr:type IV secretion system protein [Bartonella harrusi]UTO28304.1 type IV secretion system protein [Bartonella harrusi]UTO28307.1 type IV secretion system protein [Bartonella harrusi]